MNKIKEGDLYKVVKISDLTFEIKYGYYDECDRYSKYNEPIPIYPDFIENPTYTKEGFPLVTQMQNQCKYYVGNKNSESCHGCRYLKIIDDLFGICTCQYNKLKKEDEVYE